ncbi:YciI family protein [Haliea sp.]
MTAEEITAEAEYMLHKQLYVILTEVVPGRENEIMGALGEKHMEFQVGLEKNGILFAAGPLMNQDEKTYGGGGLIIIRAENLAQANDIAASDPLHAAGVRTYSIQPWLMNEGGFSISVSFSDMKYTLD